MSISRLDYPGKLPGLEQTALQINQRAVGRVMSIREGGLLDVMIAGRSYQAWSTLPAKPGDILQLRLASLQPQPLFTVVPPDDNHDPDDGITYNLSSLGTQAGRSLSRHSGLAGLYQLLEQLPLHTAGRAAAEIRRLLQILEQHSIDSSDLQYAARIKQQALSSGLFLEAMLAAGYPASMLVSDIKAQLYKTLRRLQPNRSLQLSSGKVSFAPLHQPPGSSVSVPDAPMGQVLQAYMDQQEPDEQVASASKLLKPWLENTLIALVDRQLTVIGHQAQNKSVWQLELLVRNAEQPMTIAVTVGAHKLAEEEIWVVSFHMELPAAGKLQVELQINQDAVDLTLACEQPCTRTRMLDARPALQALLATAGLGLDSMSCSIGAAP